MHPIGTTATATVRGVPGIRVLAGTDGRTSVWISAIPVASYTFHADDQVTDVATVAATVTDDDLDLIREHGLGDLADRIAASRSVPKPIEPTARGAIVLDQDSLQWVRTSPSDPASWTQHETGQDCCTYDEIDAVAVLQ